MTTEPTTKHTLWLFILAIVHKRGVADPEEGPAAIRFERAWVMAKDESDAYTQGQEAAEAQGWIPVKKGEVANDWVVPLSQEETFRAVYGKDAVNPIRPLMTHGELGEATRLISKRANLMADLSRIRHRSKQSDGTPTPVTLEYRAAGETFISDPAILGPMYDQLIAATQDAIVILDRRLIELGVQPPAPPSSSDKEG